MEFELKRSSVAEGISLEVERMSSRKATAALLRLRIKRILAVVVFLTHLCNDQLFVAENSFKRERFRLPSSDKTSLAAAMSMNFFSAFFFSSSSWKLSGCHFEQAITHSCVSLHAKNPVI
jgi:hypothetical protein